MRRLRPFANYKPDKMNKLFILDDSDDLLYAMKYILENNGYIVKILNNADNIFSEIIEFAPDILILDVNLGYESGREICKKLKMNLKTKDLPVILFSGYPKCLDNYRKCLADDIIEKPFDLKYLLQKISCVLANTKSTFNKIF
jgi:DNA-binding response OmpR family regulator